MANEAKTMQERIPGDGTVCDRAWAKYMEVACRIAARCSDEQLGITPADYLDTQTTDEVASDTTDKAAGQRDSA